MQVPAPFEYERATSVDHALALLQDRDPRPGCSAGGHSLLPMMKLRLAQPETLIDINDLADLSYIRVDGDEMRIGAMARHARRCSTPPWPPSTSRSSHDAERVIADPMVRNRGTVGGSMCQADPSEDLSAVFAAANGDQWSSARPAEAAIVAMREFHTGPYETVVGPARDARPRCGSPIRARRRERLREGRAAGRGLGRRRGRRLRSGSMATTIADVGIGLDRRRRRALRRARGRGVPARRQPATEEPFARGRASSRPRAAARQPTSAARPTTSATWPAS